jgi:HlyD family secretion protein
MSSDHEIIKRHKLAVAALGGILVSVYYIHSSNKTSPPASVESPPGPVLSVPHLAGTGTIESASRNIAIGTASAGIVKSVNVSVGDAVAENDILFTLDDQDVLANRSVRLAALEVARAEQGSAKAYLQNANILLKLVQSVKDNRAVSLQDFEQRLNNVVIAKTKVELATANIRKSQSELDAVDASHTRLTIRSPRNGHVLQVNISKGEYIQTNAVKDSAGAEHPIIVIGDLNNLGVRVDIDETDLWRFNPDGKAIAYLKGNPKLRFDMIVDHIEPLVIPRGTSSNPNNKASDSKILQVVYKIMNPAFKTYVGQQVDVYIEAPQ